MTRKPEISIYEDENLKHSVTKISFPTDTEMYQKYRKTVWLYNTGASLRKIKIISSNKDVTIKAAPSEISTLSKAAVVLEWMPTNEEPLSTFLDVKGVYPNE